MKQVTNKNLCENLEGYVYDELFSISFGVRVSEQVGDEVKFYCGCVEWLPCECMKKMIVIASCRNFVDVVFNYAVDHIMSMQVESTQLNSYTYIVTTH